MQVKLVHTNNRWKHDQSLIRMIVGDLSDVVLGRTVVIAGVVVVVATMIVFDGSGILSFGFFCLRVAE